MAISPGGLGLVGKQVHWREGSNSYYGAGGVGGANSNSDNQIWLPTGATAYGGGGGGGGAHTFNQRNGGAGGTAAVQTAHLTVFMHGTVVRT